MLALRLLGVFIFIFKVTTIIATNNSHAALQTKITRYSLFMETYRLPMLLGNNYYKYLLGIGN
jgi:hypothetical protein